MILCNPSFKPSPTEVEELKPFKVLHADGTIGLLPDIDESLRAEDFNYDVQANLGASMSFMGQYVPQSKMQDFEGIAKYAEHLIADETVPVLPSEPNPQSENV